MKSVFFSVITFFLTQAAFSWTASHKRLAEELGYLVPFIKEKLNVTQRQKLIDDYCLAPDRQLSLPANIIGDEAVAYLNGVRIVSTIQFADIRALPHMHFLLIQALRKRKYDAVAYWSGCISHVVNDAASPQQIPAVYFYENLSKVFGVQTPDGKAIVDVETSGFYVQRIFNLPQGLTTIKKLRAEYKPQAIGEKPEEVSKYLAGLPIYLRNASFKHAQFLVDNIQRCIFGQKPLPHNGVLAVAKMGTMGIAATADVLNSAWDIAVNKKKFNAEDILDEVIDAKIDQLFAKRTLLQMPLYRDVYSDASTGLVGVLAEPYYTYQQSALGHTSRLLAAAIMGSLKSHKMTYRSLNLIEFLKNEIPSPEEMPILVVAACNLSSGHRWIKKRDIFNQLKRYSDAGGRIMWIASDRATFLGDLSFSLKNIRNAGFYSPEALKEGFVHFDASLTEKGEDGTIVGTKTKKFPMMQIPDKGFEWSDLKSVLEISRDDRVKSLIFFKDDNGSVKTVGAALTRKDAADKAEHMAFSSVFFFTNVYSSVVKSFSAPQLDEVLESIFINAIDLLK